jgi:cytochrome c-type biogenesis protein CcmH
VTKYLYALVLSVALVCLGAGESRFDKVGHTLMCTCGCNQILLECNHVGCPNSEGMRAHLAKLVDTGMSDSAIYEDFAREYGHVSVAAPVGGGFNRVAWIAPFAVLLLGLFGVTVVVRKWRARPAATAAASMVEPLDDFRAQVRRETEE